MNRFLKNVAWLQAANMISLLIAFLIQYTYFLQDDVLGKKFFAFFIALFVVYESFRLVMIWEPGDILIKQLAENQNNKQNNYAIAHQGFSFSMSFACLCAASIYLSAEHICDWFFSDWLYQTNNKEHVSSLIILSVKWTALIPLCHNFILWVINLLQAKEKMKASAPLLVSLNLTRPLGALLGLLYTQNILGKSNPIEYFPFMIQGILVMYLIALVPSLFLLRRHYPRLLRNLFKKPWLPPKTPMTKKIFQLSASKKIVELYSRFPIWLALFYLSPETFTLMALTLKLFEYSKIFFAPISKTLLPQLAKLKQEKRYKYLQNQVKRVNYWGFFSGIFICALCSVGCLYILFPYIIRLNEAEIDTISKNAILLLPCFLFIGPSITNGIIFIIFDMTKTFLKLSVVQVPICAGVAFYLISQYSFYGVCAYILFYHAFTNLSGKYYAHKKIGELQDS